LAGVTDEQAAALRNVSMPGKAPGRAEIERRTAGKPSTLPGGPERRNGPASSADGHPRTLPFSSSISPPFDNPSGVTDTSSASFGPHPPGGRPMLIYLPIADTELIKYAGELNDYRRRQGMHDEGAVFVHGPGRVLGRIGANDILYVLAHGRESTNDSIAGMVRGWFGRPTQKNMTATALARQMQDSGLTTRLADLRLLVCWAGLFRTRGGVNQVPFAGQLCSALKGRGYSRIMVTGFNGAVIMQPTRNVVIEPGEAEGNQNSIMAALADRGQTRGVGGLRSTGDPGQSMAEIIQTRDPITLGYRSTWY
jgi:hypothetical protein